MDPNVPYSTLAVHKRDDGVSFLKLDREKVSNAVNMKMVSELIDAVEALDSDSSVKVKYCTRPLFLCSWSRSMFLRRLCGMSIHIITETMCPTGNRALWRRTALLRRTGVLNGCILCS